MLTFGSLFSGIGGFDLGLERAGLRCAWQVEIDAPARAVLADHWPDVPRFEDVRNVGSGNLRAVDVVCGGFPCQDLSVAGKRAGLAGERSGLWFEFHRVLAELRPEWVVIENVPGLLSSNRGADFAVLIRGLVELRYGVTWRVLDAQYFGVAQRRRRVFVVGSLRSGRSAQVLFEPESGGGDTPPRRQAGQGLATDVAASLRNAGAGTRGWTGDAETGLVAVATLNSGGNQGGFRTEPEEHLIAFAWQQGTTSKGGREWIARAGDYAGGLSANRHDAIAGGFGVRRLTPTECERLQGFPDGWTDNGQSDSARYRQLGNAVAVPCAEWIGRRLERISL